MISNNGKIKCVICDLSFYGTNDTLDMHMNDVHREEIQYIEDHGGGENFESSMNTQRVRKLKKVQAKKLMKSNK